MGKALKPGCVGPVSWRVTEPEGLVRVSVPAAVPVAMKPGRWTLPETVTAPTVASVPDPAKW